MKYFWLTFTWYWVILNEAEFGIVSNSWQLVLNLYR
jgi:hypothetical protein